MNAHMRTRRTETYNEHIKLKNINEHKQNVTKRIEHKLNAWEGKYIQ